MVELAGIAMIDRQISVLRRAGVDDIVLVTGYRAEMLERPGIATRHNPAWSGTNMVESLFCADDLFGDDLIVAYGDIIYAPFVLEALMASQNEISVVVDCAWRDYWQARFDDPLMDAESLRLDSGGRILDIGGPVATIDEIEAQYIGLTRFQGGGVAALRRIRETLGEIERPWMQSRQITKAYMTDILMELILRGTPVHAVQVDSGWLEIDTPDDLALATAAFHGRAPERRIDAAALEGSAG